MAPQPDVALVTGASRGIGRAVAVALAREGFTLSLWARTRKDLEATRALCEAAGVQAHLVRCNLNREKEITRAFRQTLKTAGEVGLLINNAGIGLRKPVEKIRPREWDQLLAVNLRAPYLLMRLALPRMKKARRGQIINIVSGAGRNGIAEMSAYCASKFGLLGLTESAGLEARQFGVKIQSVVPGSTDTHFMGRRPGKTVGKLRPDDIADLVLFLVRQDGQAWTSEANLRPLVLRR
jgi:NAD(P)-dependent dehydrogenase (short-subunit alcohol dehydrogenase family)